MHLPTGTKFELGSLSRAGAMPELEPTVLVIDDDSELRASLGQLLRSVGLDAQLFGSVSDLLDTGLPNGPTCLVLDVRLPGRSGLDYQRDLADADIRIPIIFITGHGDVPMSVQAMKDGAIEFLTKPFRDQDLIDAIHVGVAHDRSRLKDENALVVLRARFETLTARERQVMTQVVQGRLNKQIAWDIGISEVTVKVHRSNLKRKMFAASISELIRMGDKLKLLPESRATDTVLGHRNRDA